MTTVFSFKTGTEPQKRLIRALLDAQEAATMESSGLRDNFKALPNEDMEEYLSRWAKEPGVVHTYFDNEPYFRETDVIDLVTAILSDVPFLDHEISMFGATALTKKEASALFGSISRKKLDRLIPRVSAEYTGPTK